MIVQTRLRNLSNRDQIGPLLHELGLVGKGVEVGTLYGANAEDILRKWRGHLYCVDLWKNQDPKEYFDGANKINMHSVFATASKTLNHPRCTLLRMSSLAGSGKFEDGELDFAYLDANHRVDAIRADILAWWPKVRIGGILGGHDCNTRYDHETDSDAATAVFELCEALGVRPHLTWCTSWWIHKTEELDRRFREWNLGRLETEPEQPVYSDNTRSVTEYMEDGKKVVSVGEMNLTVVMPVAKFDWNLALKNLQWIRAMGCREVVTTYCSPELGEKHLAALAAYSKVVVASQIKEAGYFGTPNQVFKGAIEYVEKHHPGTAMLWVEADAIPMRPTWIEEITAEYRACGRPFMGDVYREGQLPHGTGNAVWHPNWRKYAPSLAALGTEEQGWDTICAFETLPRWHPAKTIQQIWRPPLPITSGWALKAIRPTTALFHQVKDGSLIDYLNKGEPIPLLPALCESTYNTQVRKEVVEQINWVDEPLPVIEVRDRAPRVVAPEVGSVHILIVTYAKDMDFLRYCLKSIDRYAAGFQGVTIAVPEKERGLYDWVKRANVVYFPEAEGKGMLSHMAMKCRADELCPTASAIWHLDSDCILWARTTPADLFREGKPIMVRERYADIKNPNRLLWQKNVERALGFKPEYEGMTCHPQLHIRDVYPKLRALVEDHTKMGFNEFVTSGKNDFPQSWAEWPTVCAVAIAHYRDRYYCIDYDRIKDAKECGVDPNAQYQYIYRRGRDYICECWSHGGVEKYKSDIESWLRGQCPAYYIK